MLSFSIFLPTCSAVSNLSMTDRDDPALVIGQQLGQVLARGGLNRCRAAILERAVNLVVQVDAVGDQDDL